MNPQILRPVVYAPAGDSEIGRGASDATGTLAQAKRTIAHTAREAAERLKTAASETASRAKAEAQRFASDTKETAANRIDGYGSAFHESAKSFEQQDPNIAWATHRIAERVEGIADYIRTKDLGEMRDDAENFARRHPVAFFGGLVVAGLVIGNLLKARQPAAEIDDEAPNSDPDAAFGNAGGSSEDPAMPPSEPTTL